VSIIDDDPLNLRLLKHFLGHTNYRLSLFTCGEHFLSSVRDFTPDVVLLDVQMPGIDGYEVCRRLKTDPVTRDIPVIFLSGLSCDHEIAAAFDAGADDYVTKPVRQKELLARMEIQIGLHVAQRRFAEKHARLKELEDCRDTLVHMVAHDMRALLQGLLGHLQLIEQDASDNLNSDDQESLTQAIGATQLLSRLVSEMIDVNRFENQKMPITLLPTDVRPLLEGVRASFTDAQCGHTIEIKMPATCPRILADPLLLDRTVLNLIDNARKYSPRGSVITVSVESDCADVMIGVQDQGAGIPDSQSACVFKKYGVCQRESASRNMSSGLGLAFCKLAVEQQGGSIGFVNLNGEGCQFWFKLPAAPDN